MKKRAHVNQRAATPAPSALPVSTIQIALIAFALRWVEVPIVFLHVKATMTASQDTNALTSRVLGYDASREVTPVNNPVFKTDVQQNKHATSQAVNVFHSWTYATAVKKMTNVVLAHAA